MKRFLLPVLVIAIAFSGIATAQSVSKKTTGTQTKSAASKKKPPCAADLASCADEGCGTSFDPNLNKRKNITSDDQTPTLHTLTWMKKLDDPEEFSQGDPRDELASIGEGQKVTVMAYLLVAKPEGAESCNCGLLNPDQTDNHLVLVTKTTVQKFPAGDTAAANKAAMKQREPESETAEFTPRVRLNHPNFTRQVVQPLINATPEKALLVRVTGILLFDSEHFIRHHLVRVNNWEIHPVLKLEYCTKGDKCRATSDDGWQSLDNLPVDQAQAN
jgi:hypothetical protein